MKQQMVTAERMRELYYADPFQPFQLVLRDGKRVLIAKASALLIAPSGRFVVVVGSGGSLTKIMLEFVSDVEMRSSKPRRTRRNGTRRRKAG